MEQWDPIYVPVEEPIVDIHLAIDKGRRVKIGSVIYGDIRTKF